MERVIEYLDGRHNSLFGYTRKQIKERMDTETAKGHIIEGVYKCVSHDCSECGQSVEKLVLDKTFNIPKP
jgi:hypothetical protein